MYTGERDVRPTQGGSEQCGTRETVLGMGNQGGFLGKIAFGWALKDGQY